MKLAEELIDKYGRGFKKSNLYLFVSFYQNHPDFFQLPIGKSLDMADDYIFQSLTGKFPIRLSWTHYSIILQEKTADGRVWYEQEAATEMWDTRTLQRNVSSQYYHRLLKSQDKEAVRNEMKVCTCPYSSCVEERRDVNCFCFIFSFVYKVCIVIHLFPILRKSKSLLSTKKTIVILRYSIK